MPFGLDVGGFKSSLFGYAGNKIEATQPNERIISPVSKEKAIGSKLSFGHDKWRDGNDIKMERMTTPSKMWEERWPTGLCYNLSPPANSIKERKKLKYEDSDYQRKTHHNWKKLTNYKHLALNKTKNKPKVRMVIVSAVHFVVSTENTTNPWVRLFHISWQKYNVATETKLDMCKLWHWHLCCDLCCVICNQQYVGRTINKFSTRW